MLEMTLTFKVDEETLESILEAYEIELTEEEIKNFKTQFKKAKMAEKLREDFENHLDNLADELYSERLLGKKYWMDDFEVKYDLSTGGILDQLFDEVDVELTKERAEKLKKRLDEAIENDNADYEALWDKVQEPFNEILKTWIEEMS